MRADELVTLLSGVRKSAGGWVARCPAHDDRHQSLKVDEGDDGATLLFCHAGCDTGHVVAALGLEMKDLMPDADATQRDPGPAQESPQEFDYTDEGGELLFQVVRKPGKRFLQRKPDPAGGWAYRLNGVRRVPYRLPAVLAAAAEGRVVFVVEGEKDVHSLEAAGCVATCNAGGAGKWAGDFGPYLAGAHVVVIPDNDEPGVSHAADVVASALPHAASVRALSPVDMGFPAKGDVSDWLAAGHTADELRAAIRAAEPVREGDALRLEWQSGKEQGMAGNAGNGQNDPVKAGVDRVESTHNAVPDPRRASPSVPGDPPLKGGDSPEERSAGLARESQRESQRDPRTQNHPFARTGHGTVAGPHRERPRAVVHTLADEPEPGPRAWFVDHLVPAGAVSILAGHSGLFKSFLALYLALRVCAGEAFFGHGVRAGSVLWVDAELDRDECARRAYWIARGMGLSAPPPTLHYVRPLTPIGTEHAQEDVLAAIQQHDCGLVVLDSLTVGTAGRDMKDGADAVAVMKMIEEWAGSTGAVLAIDHITKTDARGNQSEATIYGSTFKRAIARSTMKLTKAMGGAITLHPDKASFGPETPPFHFEPVFSKDGEGRRVLTLDPVDALAQSMAGAEEHMAAHDRSHIALIRLYDANLRRPVRVEAVAEEVGLAAKTVRNHMARLGPKVLTFGDNTYAPAVHNHIAGRSSDAGKAAGNGRERPDDWTEPNRSRAPF